MTTRYAILLLLGLALVMTQAFAGQVRNQISAESTSEVATAQAEVPATGCGYPAQGQRRCWRQCNLSSAVYLVGWCYTDKACVNDGECTSQTAAPCAGGAGWTGRCRTDQGGWNTN